MHKKELKLERDMDEHVYNKQNNKNSNTKEM